MSILSLTPLPSMEVSVHDKSFDAMRRDLLFTLSTQTLFLMDNGFHYKNSRGTMCKYFKVVFL